ncbi:hypothetical protein ACS0TY_034372 [Phlomoides rotata]
MIHLHTGSKIALRIPDYGPSTTSSLVSSLPLPLRSQMGMNLGVDKIFDESGRAVQKVVTKSKEEAADCMRRILRRKVMVSSARQAVACLLTTGAVLGFRYVGSKTRYCWASLILFTRTKVLVSYSTVCDEIERDYL